MRISIDAETDAVSVRVRQLLQFFLASMSTDIVDVWVSIETVSDPIGTDLTRCRALIQMRHGDRVDIEEIQSSLELAITRTMERSIRIIQRRLVMERCPRLV